MIDLTFCLLSLASLFLVVLDVVIKLHDFSNDPRALLGLSSFLQIRGDSIQKKYGIPISMEVPLVSQLFYPWPQD